MVLNTATVSLDVAPEVVTTFIRHYLDRKSRRYKPTADISYDEGLHLIRQFLRFASTQPVEDLQRFTTQWVPSPRWVKVDVVTIPTAHIAAAAETLQTQLGPQGIQLVGGKRWWQWRQPGSELQAEWIEMRSDHAARKRTGGAASTNIDISCSVTPANSRRVYLPARYRLAPQFPFPCALHDCLAAYAYLLTVQEPNTIILAGDSAGGGMVVSMLVTMRDRGIALPAGAILISPWVDLTHSFPSVADESPLDFIPSQGFHSRPSMAWPPPREDEMTEMAVDKDEKDEKGKMADMAEMAEAAVVGAGEKRVDHPCHDGKSRGDVYPARRVSATKNTKTEQTNGANGKARTTARAVAGCGLGLSIRLEEGEEGRELDGLHNQLNQPQLIRDQIQMYAVNSLIAHPLVSPILQASLGGLPPLLILTGGGEVLRDEQLYLAHKAANPTRFPPAHCFLDLHQHHHLVHRWRPTDVQLQVWDHLCHVAPTLSFTRPAKYMYRSIAQFGAWALARAQQTEIDIVDDDDVSIISHSDTDVETPPETSTDIKDPNSTRPPRRPRPAQVGKAGDPLPPFRNHMIRQRVDRNGNIYPLEPASQLPACNLPPDEIGVIKEGPVRKWIMAKREWDTKFASSKRKVEAERTKEMAQGYQTFGEGEVPPPSALAGRWRKGNQDRAEKSKKSWGMSLWSSWGSKHDKQTMQREQQADKPVESVVVTDADGANAQPLDDTNNARGKSKESSSRKSRSRSRRRTVTDEGQTEGRGRDEDMSVVDILATRKPDTETKDQGAQEVKHLDGHVAEKLPTEPKEVTPATPQPDNQVKPAEETKVETKDQSAKSTEAELSNWFQTSEALTQSDTATKANLEEPVVVKKPETERMRPDSSVLGVRLVTDVAPASTNVDSAISQKTIPAKAEHEGLDFDFGLLKSPTMPLSPSTDKAADEGLTKYDSKSPVDKSPLKFSFDQPKRSIDKAEAEGLKPQTPLPTTPSIVEPSPPAVQEPTSNPRSVRPKSSFASSLKRALTKRSANSSKNTLAIPVGSDTRVIKSSGSNRETNWKAYEANGSDDKAYESGVGVKKSLSTREPRRAPLAKTSTWKAEEAGIGGGGAGGLRARPSVSKRPLPMLKKDYVPPPTTLKSLESMAEDDELPKPGLPKARDPDAISDYLTW